MAGRSIGWPVLCSGAWAPGPWTVAAGGGSTGPGCARSGWVIAGSGSTCAARSGSIRRPHWVQNAASSAVGEPQWAQ